MAHLSPAWIGRGGLEIKCPSPQVHVGNMLSRSIDDDHKAQVQGQMWIAELEWVDVQSYCPGLPAVIVRAKRDEAFIAALRNALDAFVETMLRAREKLHQEYGGPFVREANPQVLTEAQRLFNEWRPVL